MGSVGVFVDRYPRTVSALAFGIGATALIYISWIPGPAGRMQGFPLALMAGITHALAAILTGRRVVHPKRLPKILHAGIWGGLTSLFALVIFSMALTVQIDSTNLAHSNPLIFLLLTFTFAFLGAGWALVLLSAAIGCALHTIASSVRSAPGEHLP